MLGDAVINTSDLQIKRNDITISTKVIQLRALEPIRVGTVGRDREGERIQSNKGHAVTISAHGGGVGSKTGLYFCDGVVRRLHPQECLRVMGFPANYKILDKFNTCYTLFGNSVIISLVGDIFRKVMKVLIGEIVDANPVQLEFPMAND